MKISRAVFQKIGLIDHFLNNGELCAFVQKYLESNYWKPRGRKNAKCEKLL